MRYALTVCLLLALNYSCSRINQQSRDYYASQHPSHGIIILSDAPEAQEEVTGSALKGKELYQANCLSCHGATGEGNGPEAGSAPRQPANLKKLVREVGNFRFYVNMSKWKGEMPGWKRDFSQLELDDLVAYIKTFK